MTYRIAVVGGGPAAISFCQQLIDEIKSSDLGTQPVEIVVFEKSHQIGTGLPYSKPDECYILNLPIDSMSHVYNEREAFGKWLALRYSGESKFPPRHYFGEFLKAVTLRLPEDASAVGVKITYQTNSPVNNILPLVTENYLVSSGSENTIFDSVVLCTGHLPSNKFQEFKDNTGYCLDPWADNAYDNIAPDAAVAIVGSRLTAIDVAVKLQSLKHTGPIIMASRSGLLPAVLGREVTPYTLKYLTINTLWHHTNAGLQHLPLHDLAALVSQEIAEAQGAPFDFDAIVKSDKDLSQRVWLDQQIAAAEGGSRGWQQVLFALYPIIPFIWPMLSLADQKFFMKNIYSPFITYMAAFPLENAYKIRDMIKSGQLRVTGGLSRVTYQDQQYTLTVRKGTESASHLFNATGPGDDVTQVPLYANMLNNKIVVKNPLGGLKVNPRSLQVIDTKGRPYKNMFAIGNATFGDCLATLDMSQVAFQARIAASVGVLPMIVKKNLSSSRTATVLAPASSVQTSLKFAANLLKHLVR